MHACLTRSCRSSPVSIRSVVFNFSSRNYSFAYHSVQEVAAMYPDRVITIRGTIDNMSNAEACISSKLRECYEKEMNQPVVSYNEVSIGSCFCTYICWYRERSILLIYDSGC